jgi:hypothetical protein
VIILVSCAKIIHEHMRYHWLTTRNIARIRQHWKCFNFEAKCCSSLPKLSVRNTSQAFSLRRTFYKVLRGRS